MYSFKMRIKAPLMEIIEKFVSAMNCNGEYSNPKEFCGCYCGPTKISEVHDVTDGCVADVIGTLKRFADVSEGTVSLASLSKTLGLTIETYLESDEDVIHYVVDNGKVFIDDETPYASFSYDELNDAEEDEDLDLFENLEEESEGKINRHNWKKCFENPNCPYVIDSKLVFGGFGNCEYTYVRQEYRTRKTGSRAGITTDTRAFAKNIGNCRSEDVRHGYMPET